MTRIKLLVTAYKQVERRHTGLNKILTSDAQQGVVWWQGGLYAFYMIKKLMGLPWWSSGERLHGPSAGGPGLIPGQGTRSTCHN